MSPNKRNGSTSVSYWTTTIRDKNPLAIFQKVIASFHISYSIMEDKGHIPSLKVLFFFRVEKYLFTLGFSNQVQNHI